MALCAVFNGVLMAVLAPVAGVPQNLHWPCVLLAATLGAAGVPLVSRWVICARNRKVAAGHCPWCGSDIYGMKPGQRCYGCGRDPHA